MRRVVYMAHKGEMVRIADPLTGIQDGLEHLEHGGWTCENMGSGPVARLDVWQPNDATSGKDPVYMYEALVVYTFAGRAYYIWARELDDLLDVVEHYIRTTGGDDDDDDDDDDSDAPEHGALEATVLEPSYYGFSPAREIGGEPDIIEVHNGRAAR